MHKTSLFDEGPPEPVPQRFNMAHYAVGAPARRHPRAIAMIVADGGEGAAAQWSFGDIDRAVRRIARALNDAGVRRGERVALCLGDRPEFPALHFGAMAAGAVAVPLSSQLSPRETALVIDDCDAALVCGGAPVEGRRHWTSKTIAGILAHGDEADYTDTGAEDPAFLVYTSGSTGRPKGVLHAHRSAWGRRMMRAGWHGLGPGDRILHAGAFNWTYTLGVGLSDPWSVGASAILFSGDRRQAAWSALARAHGATAFAAVPGVYRQMLKREEKTLREGFAGLTRALTAGEAMPASLRASWEAATGVPLHEALGMTECSTYISSSALTPPAAGRAGRPQAGRRVAILPREGGTEPVPCDEVGILAVHRRDPGLMLRYWNREREMGEAMRGEWFLTGDLAAMDEAGYIAYHGRADDLMNAGGYRVSPLEVEAALGRHASVAECACAELRVNDALSIIGAFVVVKDNVDGAALSAHCAALLARYKCPREFILVDALPRNANGKINRRALPDLWRPR